jgi:predicted dehydrogenase/threonine dehydrogenase-like Zn-dependent dehydrogenase
MKQLTENLRNGVVRIVNNPRPSCGSMEILVRNVASLISPGTEKLMIEMGKKSLAGKAISRPDLARTAYEKAKREGFFNVFREALARLEQPLPLGYSSSGVVIEVGSQVKGFTVGDAVACAGSGYASHAEYISVPSDLAVKLTTKGNEPLLSFEESSFVMLGGIALQGFRCAMLTQGESVVVVGLGLIGLLTLQIAHAYGCTAIGVDIDKEKILLAKKLGIDNSFAIGEDDVEQTILNITKGQGADAIILAAATEDNSPIIFAERIARKRGHIVLVGVSELSLTRKAFWDKELTFTVSKASGPAMDGANNLVSMPVELVRWTEKRNLEEFLRLVEERRISLTPLITHRYSIDESSNAYDLILKGTERYVGIIISYPENTDSSSKVVRHNLTKEEKLSNIEPPRNHIGLIGAGMFTRNIFLPVAKRSGAFKFIGVAAKSGLNSGHVAETFGFAYTTTDYSAILNDATIGSVLITTRHNLHGSMVAEALHAGKHVFVEKPLAIKDEDLRIIEEAFYKRNKTQLLMVGFNRRYAPLAKELLAGFENRITPLQILYRVNAGYIPGEHWTQDRTVGGGRIIGEVCHFVDFCQFLTKSDPIEVYTTSISGQMGKYYEHDNIQLSIRFQDGSLATIIYTALGSKMYSRERVEVFGGDIVGVLEDFKSLELFSGGKKKRKSLWNQDMGYTQELKYFLQCDPQYAEEIFHSILLTTRTTFAAMESLAKGKPISLLEVNR